jgi:hypothetical protein
MLYPLYLGAVVQVQQVQVVRKPRPEVLVQRVLELQEPMLQPQPSQVPSQRQVQNSAPQSRASSQARPQVDSLQAQEPQVPSAQPVVEAYLIKQATF